MSAQLALEILDRTDASIEGLWPRAAAVLGRQALEEKILALIGAEFEGCSMRAQLLVLEEKLGRAKAGEFAYAYGELSEACHYHPYRSAPVLTELREWIGSLL